VNDKKKRRRVMEELKKIAEETAEDVERRLQTCITTLLTTTKNSIYHISQKTYLHAEERAALASLRNVQTQMLSAEKLLKDYVGIVYAETDDTDQHKQLSTEYESLRQEHTTLLEQYAENELQLIELVNTTKDLRSQLHATQDQLKQQQTLVLDKVRQTEYEEENQALMKELQQLEAARHEQLQLKTENQTLTERLKDALAQIKDDRVATETLTQELQAESQDLKEKILRLEEQVHSMTNEREALTAVAKDQESRFYKEVQNTRILTKKLEDMQSNSDRERQAMQEELQQDLRLQIEENMKLRDLESQLQKELQVRTDESQVLTKKLEALRTDSRQHEDRVKCLQQELRIKTEEITDLKSQLHINQVLLKQLEDIQTNNGDTDNKLKQLEQDLRLKIEEAAGLESQLRATIEENEALTEKLKDSDSAAQEEEVLRSQLLVLKEENEALTEKDMQCQELQTILEEREQELRTAQTQLKEKIQELCQLQAESDTVRSALEAKNQEMAEVNAQLEQIQVSTDQLTEEAEVLKQIEAQLCLKTEEAEQLQQNLENSRAELKRAQEQWTQEEQKLEAANLEQQQQVCAELEARHAATVESLDLEHKKKLDKLKNRLHQLSSKLRIEKQTRETQGAAFKTHEMTVRQLEENIRHMKEEEQSYKEETDRLRRDNQRFKKLVKQLTQSVKEHRTLVENTNSESLVKEAELFTQLTAVRKELEQLQTLSQEPEETVSVRDVIYKVLCDLEQGCIVVKPHTSCPQLFLPTISQLRFDLTYYLDMLKVLAVDIQCRQGNRLRDQSYLLLSKPPTDRNSSAFYTHSKLLLFSYGVCVTPLLQALVSTIPSMEESALRTLRKELNHLFKLMTQNQLEHGEATLYLSETATDTPSISSNSVFVFLSKLSTDSLIGSGVQPKTASDLMTQQLQAGPTWFSKIVRHVAVTALQGVSDADARSTYPSLDAARRGSVCETEKSERLNTTSQADELVQQLNSASYSGHRLLWDSACNKLRLLQKERGSLYLDTNSIRLMIQRARDKQLNTRTLYEMLNIQNGM